MEDLSKITRDVDENMTIEPTASPPDLSRRTATVVDFQLPPTEQEEDAKEEPKHKQGNRGRFLRKRSCSSMSNSTHYDNHLLRRAVSDAGRWAYGIILVEVWALSYDRTYLFRPEAGWWIDPVYHNPRCDEQCQICRLVDSNHPDYVAPRHLSPGEGLPGVLWSEVTSSWTRSFRESLASRILGSTTSSFRSSFQQEQGIQLNPHFSSHIVWRSVPQLQDDPDQPWNPRLKLLASVGLGLAAAVPFDLHGDQGIVIYMAREGVEMRRLQSETNEAYLISASDLIAAAYAFRGPRQEVVRERRTDLSNGLDRVRQKIIDIQRQGLTLKDYVERNAAQAKPPQEPERRRSYSSLSYVLNQLASSVCRAINTTLKKSKGSGAPVPPTFSWRQTTLTFVGCFSTLLVITSLSDRFVTLWGPEYGIVLGPFGALMTLLYGLTAAPASQPRNAIVGQTVSMTVAIALTYARSLPVWLRQSLGASLAISLMVKLGVTHPPAGASALLLATSTTNDTITSFWGSMATSLLGNVIAIVMATLINNVSNKRQYPIYWGVSTVADGCRESLIWMWTWLMRVLSMLTQSCRCARLPASLSLHHPHRSSQGTRSIRTPANHNRRKRASRRVGLEEVEEESV